MGGAVERAGDQLALTATSATSVRQPVETFELRPARSRSLRMFLRTFPVDVLGSGPNSTATGALKCARFCRQKSMMSRSSARAPAAKVTNAFGRFGLAVL